MFAAAAANILEIRPINQFSVYSKSYYTDFSGEIFVIYFQQHWNDREMKTKRFFFLNWNTTFDE